ncbi:hypothetical protein BKA67DRAFT_170990 [Truncatella angustata]|uniref:Uncharacterized protein n=1 Tax=Truncatella angustata TaxID=152316 RepID=A0A9P8UR52_9PEZI|nr:uncharacterized protein BKA67DRAFT_170990 [Truncatella angustata]KAH6656833.1 hypothetical protein BKA67DRAFT_170990 [Truncatella angustata]
MILQVLMGFLLYCSSHLRHHFNRRATRPAHWGGWRLDRARGTEIEMRRAPSQPGAPLTRIVASYGMICKGPNTDMASHNHFTMRCDINIICTAGHLQILLESLQQEPRGNSQRKMSCVVHTSWTSQSLHEYK